MPHTAIQRLTSVFILMLAGTASVYAQSPDASPTARIRLFGQNGVAVNMYRNSKCEGGEKVKVSGGLGDAFSSFLGVIRNESIGMPDTPNSVNPQARNGIMSKAFFREYEVAAGQPLTIAMTFMNVSAPVPKELRQWSTTATCRTLLTTFIPEQGKNYEGVLDVRSDLGACIQQINEIKVTEGEVELQPVAPIPTESCAE